MNDNKKPLMLHWDPFPNLQEHFYTRCGLTWPSGIILEHAGVFHTAEEVDRFVNILGVGFSNISLKEDLFYCAWEVSICPECVSHPLFHLTLLGNTEL